MALAYVGFDELTNDSGLATHDFTVTVASGTDLIVALVMWRLNQSVSSVTWDVGGADESLSVVANTTQTTHSNIQCSMYQLAGPTVGSSKTFRLAFTGSVRCYSYLLHFSGADQTTPVASGTSSTDFSTTSRSVSLSPAAGEIGIAGLVSDDDNAGDLPFTFTGSGTEIDAPTDKGFDISGCGRNANGQTSIGWSWSTAEQASITGAIIKAAAGGATADPGAGSLTFTGTAPTVGQDISRTPGLASVSIGAFAPTVTQALALAPGKGDITLEAFAPTVGQDVATAPGLGAISLEAFAPTPSVSAGAVQAPGKADITLEAFAPTVGQDVAPAPGKADISISALAPTVTVGAPAIVVTPDKAALAYTGIAPAVGQNVVKAPGLASVSFTAIAPAVTVAGAFTATPGLATLAFAGLAPTVQANIWTIQSEASQTWTVQTEASETWTVQ